MELESESTERMEIETPSQEKASTSKGSSSLGGIEDYELPKAAINRCLKNALPSRPSHKDLKTALSRSATLFVPYLVAAAQQVATERNLKTIGASHIDEALKRLGFAEWIETIAERMRLEREEKLARKRRKHQATLGDSEKRDDAEEEGAAEDEEDLVVDEERQSESEGGNDEEAAAENDVFDEAF